MAGSTTLTVIGAGGHARAVIGCAVDAGFTVDAVVDTRFSGQDEAIFGHRVTGLDHLDGLEAGASVALALGDNATRKEWWAKLRERGFSVPTILHPTAHVSRFATIGEGTLVSPGVMVRAGANVGENCILNTGAILDHETRIGDHTHVAPGCHIAGRVKVGALCFLGIGSTIRDKITIGDEVTVGAGAVVIRDIEGGQTVAGVPARRLG